MGVSVGLAPAARWCQRLPVRSVAVAAAAASPAYPPERCGTPAQQCPVVAVMAVHACC